MACWEGSWRATIKSSSAPRGVSSLGALIPSVFWKTRGSSRSISGLFMFPLEHDLVGPGAEEPGLRKRDRVDPPVGTLGVLAPSVHASIDAFGPSGQDDLAFGAGG